MRMKKSYSLVLALLLVAGALTLTGCAKAPPTTPPVAPPVGSLNSFDSTTNETLQALHAAVASFVADNNSGKFVLTASQKSLLNQVVTDLNTADLIYQAWHNAGGTEAQAPVTAAVSKVQTDQTALNAALQGGK
jgi:hypothetical protein